MKKLANKYITLCVLSTLLLSCIKYSPYEVTVSAEEANLTAKNLDKLNAMDQSDDTIRLAFIGDTQRFYDESEDFVKAINKRNDIDFVAISGDLTDFGLDDEFTGIAEIFNRLKVPYLTVIGNHDLVYNGRQVYEEMFGPLDYSFFFKRLKFIMVNTNSREFAFDGSVPNISWLNQQLSDTGAYRNAIVVSHVPPGHSDFDSALELPFTQTLSKWKKTTLSLNGHNHNFDINTPFGDNVTYLTSFSIEKGYYTDLKIWPGGFDFKNIEL